MRIPQKDSLKHGVNGGTQINLFYCNCGCQFGKQGLNFCLLDLRVFSKFCMPNLGFLGPPINIHPRISNLLLQNFFPTMMTRIVLCL